MFITAAKDREPCQRYRGPFHKDVDRPLSDWSMTTTWLASVETEASARSRMSSPQTCGTKTRYSAAAGSRIHLPRGGGDLWQRHVLLPSSISGRGRKPRTA